jgi:hypothetical protein
MPWPGWSPSAAGSLLVVFGVPDAVPRLRIPVAVGAGEETGVDVELEELLVEQVVGAERELGALGEKLVDERRAKDVVVTGASLAPQVEGILVLGAWERMQRVAGVTQEVIALRRGNQEGEQPIVGEQGADRMQPGAAVWADGREKREPDSELVEQVPPSAREVRSFRLQVPPGCHEDTFVSRPLGVNPSGEGHARCGRG